MKIKSVLFVVVAALVVSCGGKGGGRPNFGDNEYPVRTVGTADAAMQTTYPATIKGVQDVEIRPKVSGFITRVCVREGQNVGAGQLLFVIDNVTYQATVRQAQASVNTAKAQLNTAKLTYDNNQKLFDQNVIGEYELSTAKNSYETAQAALAQAQAALASAKETLSFCYVKSPASGVVGSIPYAQAAISQMPPVKLQLADGSLYNHPGKVTKMSGVIDPATGSVQMIAVFLNPERLLKSGGSGAIVVPYVSTNSVIIPQSCVSEIQDKKFVYTVGKDNKVKFTEITVDPQNDGNNYVVVSGLTAGDRYVTNGITKLNDGMEIKPITEAQYQKKIQEATKLSESGSAKGFVEAMTGKK